MMIIEADALRVQTVEVRRLQPWIAVTGQIAVALVVRNQEDDVRGTASLRQHSGRSGGQKKASSSHCVWKSHCPTDIY
jgi:hypothetical protein